MTRSTEDNREKALEPKVDNQTLNIVTEDPLLKDTLRTKQKSGTEPQPERICNLGKAEC